MKGALCAGDLKKTPDRTKKERWCFAHPELKKKIGTNVTPFCTNSQEEKKREIFILEPELWGTGHFGTGNRGTGTGSREPYGGNQGTGSRGPVPWFPCGSPCGSPLLGTGYWVLGTGYWVLGTGYWVLGTGYWVLGTGYWVLGTGQRRHLDSLQVTVKIRYVNVFNFQLLV